nr:MFS transporter [Geodermatophilus sabuli]
MLPRWDFRRLLATRLAAQFGDGVLQAALAGTVLFNPQRAADPLDVALGFAVLLLPYSVVGPFAGVWLDRWSRRQVLVRAGLVRAALVAGLAALVWAGVAGAGFYVVGLAVFSVNRFVLSALSAALPHTADEPSLVSANALSTTCGAVATVGGGAVAVGLLQLGDAGDGAYALLTLAAAVPYLVAAGVVSRFSREHLGPDHPAGSPALSLREVAAGMVAGAQHAWERPPAAAALAVITAHRLCFGLVTLMSMLLFRNTFTTGGLVPGGLAGLGLVVAAGAGGSLLAAAVTPAVVRRLGKARWVSVLLAGAGPALVALSLPFLPVTAVLVGLVLGFVGQAVKICVDTTLQESMEDDFRGRVFSVYDTLVNVSYVTALLAAALLLPPSGISVALVVTVGAVYAVSAVASLRIAR